METNCQTQKDQVVCNCFKYYVVPVFLSITPQSHKVAEKKTRRQNNCSFIFLVLAFDFEQIYDSLESKDTYLLKKTRQIIRDQI